MDSFFLPSLSVKTFWHMKYLKAFLLIFKIKFSLTGFK
jgi:hypothetical protein